uniref:Uncharacterized protein n=1 Tax=Helianthus annuus TaxID=4232 RepID=A0A251VS54_HELAN
MICIFSSSTRLSPSLSFSLLFPLFSYISGFFPLSPVLNIDDLKIYRATLNFLLKVFSDLLGYP